MLEYKENFYFAAVRVSGGSFYSKVQILNSKNILELISLEFSKSNIILAISTEKL